MTKLGTVRSQAAMSLSHELEAIIFKLGNRTSAKMFTFVVTDRSRSRLVHFLLENEYFDDFDCHYR